MCSTKVVDYRTSTYLEVIINTGSYLDYRTDVGSLGLLLCQLVIIIQTWEEVRDEPTWEDRLSYKCGMYTIHCAYGISVYLVFVYIHEGW